MIKEAIDLAKDAQKLFEKRNKNIEIRKNKINENDLLHNDKKENKVQKSNEIGNILFSIKPKSLQKKLIISEKED